MQELLSQLNDIVKSSDKNVRTRALWVISKQTFPTEVVGKMVSAIIDTLEIVFNKGEIHSAVVDFEALNVIIRLIEQAPVQMGEESVRWAKLVIPLVVHSAQKVHLRGATALEMGMPLLLQKQQEIASITEHLMTTKLISELQKLFMSKNETYVLKLWPLFVRLLGKTLHRSGSFINSLLQLEELGFRSGTPMIKKIAFIAWKSLIDNFALNPDILCSAKRLKLLMQPLSSIHVRTETLALTKLEVWWYLLMRLGPHLPANFEQVCVPLIQSTISDSSASPPGNSSRVTASPGLSPVTPVHKGASPYGVPVTPRMNMSTSLGGMAAIPSIQLLGLEMLLHFLLGPEVLSFAKQHKLVLSLEPLEHPLISSPSFFSKHAHTLITAVHDSFVAVGRDASDAVVNAIWKELISLVNSLTESGNKKERPGSEVLTLLLKSLESIVKSEVLPVSKTLVLMEITIKGLPQKVLGSPAYQVANMDILNGTPALFLIQLIFSNYLRECGTADERFFLNLESLVGCVLSGPTSPLAFSDSVLSVINQNAVQLENKEHLCRMWSIIVTPLTELINQTNEVNQGDALEHNFSAIYSALTLPINHIFSAQRFPVVTMKALLRTWSELYRIFARCAALVATAEENLCCEELSSKIMSTSEDAAFLNLLFLDRIIHIITVIADCIDFSPYNNKYQPKVKSPQRSSDWAKKKKDPLGRLASLFKLIVKVIGSFHTLSFEEAHSDSLLGIGSSVISVISSLLGHISLPSAIRKIFTVLTRPLALFYENTNLDEVPKVYSSLNNKLEKLLGEITTCLQFSAGTFDSELLEQLSPLLCIIFLHRNKQIRKQTAQFWNATFAKVAMLTYPEELKPVLREAKQKFLLLLPGLENVEIMEESSGSYSDTTENSQLNMKISGMERKSNGKRDSFLAQTKEKKENMKPSAKLKRESSSPKVKSELLLEEEKSTDFVFIPPEGKESKERILTEHQKEVLKTKRCDIPAMYNNLDVSQDTLFTDCYSQEDSIQTSTLTEKPKEDTKMVIKEEQVKSDTVVQDALENCGMDEHSKKASFSSNECGFVPKTSPEILSSNNEARKNTLISSKKTSTECTSSAENSLVCSRSVSDASISGTPPPYPTSRRQSFITLEKFGGSDTRPFSPSSLGNMSSSVSVQKTQENMTTTDSTPKTKKREVVHSKSDSEKNPNGVKRSSRRLNKAEKSASKRSKPLIKSEQEEKKESVESTVALENNSPDLFNQTECSSDGQVHLSESVPEHEDRKPKPAVENTVLLENSTVQEKNMGINLESKENTPPAVTPADQTVNEDSQSQVTPSQKILRRSSRRRSEITDTIGDKQDKENSHQKRERRKEEEKPQGFLHVKDDVLPKQQTGQENLLEKGNYLHEKASDESSANADTDQNKRKSDLENVNSEGGGALDAADKSSEKPLRGRTRYQTRRASQGLLSSIENSESDSSEAKEEGSRKKRSAKLKNKSSDSVDTEEQEGKMVEGESVTVKNHTQNYKAISEVDVEKRPPVYEKGESNAVILECSTASADKLHVSDDVPNTCEGKTKTSESSEHSLAKVQSTPSSIPESNLRTRNASKRLLKRDSDSSSVGECSRIGTPEISTPPEKNVQIYECHHKRSRRVRRSKGCDCCGEKSQPQEKSSIGLKNTENTEIKSSEMKKMDVQTPDTVVEAASKAHLCSEVKHLDEHASVNFNLVLKGNDTVSENILEPETKSKENTIQKSSEVVNLEEKPHERDSGEAVCPVSEEPSSKKFKAVDPCLGDLRDISEECHLDATEGKPETPLKRELRVANIEEGNACKTRGGSSTELAKAMELDAENYTSEASVSEKECIKTDTSELATEECKSSDRPSAETADKLDAEEVTAEKFGSGIGLGDNTVPINVKPQTEISEQIAGGELGDRSNESDSASSKQMNAEVENYEEMVIGHMNHEIGSVTETEDEDVTAQTKLEESKTEQLNAELDSFVPDTLEMSTEEGRVESKKTETNIELSKSEETNLGDSPVAVGSDVLLEDSHTPDKTEEPSQSSTSETTISELVMENNDSSPEKLRELDSLLLSANDSPGGMQTRCVWSPLASPSTSILKRGLKRLQEDEVSSPVNKVRRVSFADPIYQAGLADDIDRRGPLVRSHSSNNSPVIKSVRTSPTSQTKHNTTSAKGFLSPGSRNCKFKTSKKCLITEMAKESTPYPSGSVYPALMNCVAPVDIILPQITSNMWARGLGQLIRAKNIKTIGDLSTLTASEIKTLPIRSPKVSNVRKALRMYHEQQMKSQGLEEIPVFDISEKTLNGIENKSADEERLASDLIDPVTLETPLSKNLVAQISALALQLDSEDLHNYSGSQLFEMHEKLGTMANSIIKNLQSRWRSPANENSS
uniref:Replication timing regulatory factor 1 n=2 Tax=Chinchilla lanigera TaxID=34839 RepID=A0A8C2UNP4_CHILA